MFVCWPTWAGGGWGMIGLQNLLFFGPKKVITINTGHSRWRRHSCGGDRDEWRVHVWRGRVSGPESTLLNTDLRYLRCFTVHRLVPVWRDRAIFLQDSYPTFRIDADPVPVTTYLTKAGFLLIQIVLDMPSIFICDIKKTVSVSHNNSVHLGFQSKLTPEAGWSEYWKSPY